MVLILGMKRRKRRILNNLSNLKTRRKEMSGKIWDSSNNEGNEMMTRKKSKRFQGFLMYPSQE